jgi:hypothetical protein
MKKRTNIIAESKTTDLIVQVNYKDDHIIRGQVLVGDKYNEIGKVDYWSTNTFNISDNNNTDIPKHYNNDNGTLYKIAKERGWNAYLFDIVKRLERSEKKGEFESDLNKSKVVIDLWLKENKLC